MSFIINKLKPTKLSCCLQRCATDNNRKDMHQTSLLFTAIKCGPNNGLTSICLTYIRIPERIEWERFRRRALQNATHEIPTNFWLLTFAFTIWSSFKSACFVYFHTDLSRYREKCRPQYISIWHLYAIHIIQLHVHLYDIIFETFMRF